MEKIPNYIDGKLVDPISGQYLDNFEPATGSAYSLVPDSDSDDVEQAVLAADRAFPAWSSMPAENRSKILTRIADLIEGKTEDLARAETIDNGKPISLSRSLDIPRAVSNFRFFATAILHFSSACHAQDDQAINYTLRKPIGAVACISPWNLPLYLLTWKIAPAIATGNTVVAKPSEITPMTAFLLSQICLEAGLPPGVLNLVHGYGPKVGRAMTTHPKLKAISFTGSTKTGAEIASLAGPLFKKTSLELGGKNPNIVFADCDIEQALDTSVRSAFTNQGQVCLSGSRIFVERPLFDQFKERFVKTAARLTPGDPLDDQTQQGAVVSKAHMEKILSYIDLAKEEGGTILLGGERKQLSGRCQNGWFIAPAIIEGLSTDCRTNQEEIFGPVVTLTPFDSDEEVVELANSTPYGLAASIWTKDISRAHCLADAIDSGIIWINCWMLRDLRTPFGGMKQSGIGREGGFEALHFFTESKNVCVKLRGPG